MLLAAAVVLGSAVLRADHFSSWPPGLSHDEAINGLDAIRLLRTGVIPLYAHDGRPEPLFRFIQAISIMLVGPTRFGLRLASLFTGVLTVAAAYRAGRHLVPQDSPYRRYVGLITAGVLAVMIGHIHLSRVAYRAILQPFAMLMFFDAFISAWEQRSKKQFALAGMWLGIALMSYTAAFILLPLVGLIFVQQIAAWLIDLPESMERGPKLGGILLFILVSLLVASPLLIMWSVQPELFGRAEEVGGTPFSMVFSRPGEVLARLRLAWQAINQVGDINPQYNVAQAPLLDGIVLYVMLLLGLFGCVIRPRRAASWLAAGYLVLGLLPVALADEIPHGLRIAGEYAALPLVITASADLFLTLPGRLKRPAWGGKVFAGIYMLGMAAVLVFNGAEASKIYRDYAQSDMRWGEEGTISIFSWFFETRRLAVAEIISAVDEPVYIPLSEAGRSSLRYFTSDSYRRIETFSTYFSGEGQLELPSGQFLIAPGSEDATTFAVFMPDGTLVLLPRFDDSTLSALEAALKETGQPLFDAYGELAATRVDFPAGEKNIVITDPVANQLGMVNYDGQIGLLGMDADLVLPQEGGEVPVTLYFTPGQEKRRDITALTQLWTISSEPVSGSYGEQLHRWLYPPDQWQSGDIVPFETRLIVPGGLPPGAYHVGVTLQNWLSNPLPVLGADGAPVANAATAGVVKIPHLQAVSTEGMIPVGAVFGDEITLLGFKLSDAASGEALQMLEPGQSVVVTLYWQALRRPKTDYTIFVHLGDATNILIAQNDSQPEGGQYPTGIWSTGEIVLTTHLLIIPPESQGPFTLHTGLYSWPDLERLPVIQDGEQAEDSRARLGGAY